MKKTSEWIQQYLQWANRDNPPDCSFAEEACHTERLALFTVTFLLHGVATMAAGLLKGRYTDPVLVVRERQPILILQVQSPVQHVPSMYSTPSGEQLRVASSIPNATETLSKAKRWEKR